MLAVVLANVRMVVDRMGCGGRVLEKRDWVRRETAVDGLVGVAKLRAVAAGRCEAAKVERDERGIAVRSIAGGGSG